jgi:hypothetical protein
MDGANSTRQACYCLPYRWLEFSFTKLSDIQHIEYASFVGFFSIVGVFAGICRRLPTYHRAAPAGTLCRCRTFDVSVYVLGAGVAPLSSQPAALALEAG